jgi:hypothetical protein
MKNEYVKFQYLFTKVFVSEDSIQVKSVGKNLSFKKGNVRSVSTGSLSRKARINIGGKKDIEVQFGNKNDLHNFTDFLNGTKSFTDLKNIYGTVDVSLVTKGTFFSRRNANIFGIIFFLGALGSLTNSLWLALVYLLAGLLIFPKTYDLLRSKANFNLSKNGRVIASFVLLMIAGIVFTSTHSPTQSSSSSNTSGNAPSPERTTTDRRITSIVFAEDVIKNILKSPSIAKFVDVQAYELSNEKDVWAVNGYVDSQNSFGALIRTQWEVQLDYRDGKGGTVKSILFDGKRIL